MIRALVAVLACTGVSSAQSLLGLPLDIGTLLSSLKPAADNDPRFTNFKPASSGDGTSTFWNGDLLLMFLSIVRSPCPGLNGKLYT
jgi:hypothetical protein